MMHTLWTLTFLWEKIYFTIEIGKDLSRLVSHFDLVKLKLNMIKYMYQARCYEGLTLQGRYTPKASQVIYVFLPLII